MIFESSFVRRKRTDLETGQSVIADPVKSAEPDKERKEEPAKKQDPKPDSIVRVKKTEI